MIRDVHHSNMKFTSINDMKHQVMKEFESQVPEPIDFQIGYYFGKSSIVTQKDLASMYKIGQTLWCNAQPQPPSINGTTCTCHAI